ncbi:hypothetical protein [Polaribacter sp. HaHaR_3_91]|uniref:hypothetical protein n=1 Tax=Polaribacter sp. HaHaR_3_91 TaxID=2745561 RepID=UPI001C4FD50A|nr:hypothetical protein [Polaribacter sp. HaHaR_3_91]QXP63243.1 hypothetical protein H0I27_15550 [Polaribacter sp. HaHaR_3_91]
MANPIVEQINEELKTLQDELTQFKSNVDYLNNAKTLVKEAIASVNYSEVNFDKKISELKRTYNSFINLSDKVTSVVLKLDTINFPERLDGIEISVKETITNLNEIKKATLDELKKASEIITKADFDGKFKNLQTTVDSSVKSNKELLETFEKQRIGEKIECFEKSISKRIHESYKEVTNKTNQISTVTAKSIHDLNLTIRIDKLDVNIAGILSSVQNVSSRIDIVERNIGDKLKETADKQLNLISLLDKKLESIEKKQKINTYITWVIIIIVGVIIKVL